MAYADKDELADYLGKDKADLPDDADRLLDRATELIDYYTHHRIDSDDSDSTEVAQKAVCAQVEWWLNHNDELGLKSHVQSYSSGDYSVSFSEGGLPALAPRARRPLHSENLLYAGAELK